MSIRLKINLISKYNLKEAKVDHIGQNYTINVLIDFKGQN